MNATIKDVAKAAGVSFKTVSRVMNNEPGVRADTAERVRTSAAELGYAVNQSARRLASGRTGSIGIVVYTALNWQWTADVVSGAVARARSRGYGVAPFILDHYEREQRDAMLWLASHHAVDGVILTTPWNEFPLLHAELAERGMPIVLLPGGEKARWPSVRSTDDAGAEALTDHLLALGHRRFGVIGGQAELEQTRLRLKGFGRSLRRAGLDPETCPRVLDNYALATGRQGAHALLTAPDPPTALFCLSDLLAAGALRMAHELGFRVPDELSIVGIGNHLAAEMVWPSLTTVAVPAAEMAGAAVDLLLGEVAGRPDRPFEAVFETTLVLRDSTGPAPDHGGGRPRGPVRAGASLS